MQRLLLLTLCWVSAGSLYAQTDSVVSFIAYWNKGDSKVYNITKKIDQFTDGAQTRNEVQAYEVTLNVVDATDEAYKLEWTGGQMLQDNTELPAEVQQKVDKLMKKHKDLNIEYTTDALGTFMGIDNWKELSRMMNELLKEMGKAAPGKEQENFNRAMKGMREAYSSQQGIEQLVFKEVQYLHWPMGIEISTTDTLVFEDALPNVITGGTIKALGKVYFLNVNADDGICTFVHSLVMDPEEMRKSITAMMQQLAAGMKFSSEEEKQQRLQEMEQTFAAMKMDVRDTNTFVYDYANGWPISISIKREIDITADGKQALRINETLIEEVLPE